MYPLLAIVPLLVGGVIALLLGVSEQAGRYAKYVAFAGSLGSAILSVMLILNSAGYANSITWFTLSHYSFQLDVSLLGINQILLALIAIISPLIFLYSIGYMEVPSEQSRFYSELSIFAASMMLLAMSGGFLTMFIAWEGLGITSYLLIGFWYYRKNPPNAARKAITTILIGDIFMLAGILAIFSQFGTFNFTSILLTATQTAINTKLVWLGALFILIGAFTKSAQFPFHEWLSDAMEGPTPVSAFLHSSTMVKAGVFVVALTFTLFLKLNLLPVILVIGLITMVIGALNALSSDHIKKILAYSTVKELGLMFVAIGLNALPAALIFFVVQTGYKALLFMSAGTIMKANNDDTNIYEVSAFGKNKVLVVSAFIAALAAAGIFPFSGFFGKASIDAAASTNTIVYVVLIIVDFLSAAYVFRWLFIPMSNQRGNLKMSITGRYLTMKRSMVVPQVLLAVSVIVLSAMMLLPGVFPSLNILSTLIKLTSQNLVSLGAVVTSAAALLGIAVAYLLFWRRAEIFSKKSRIRLFLSNGFFINDMYLSFTVMIASMANVVERFDVQLNRLFSAGARGVVDLGKAARISQRGSVNVYIAALAVGIVFVLALLVFVQ